MSRPLKEILEDYRRLRQTLQEARSAFHDDHETLEVLRDRLRRHVLRIRREAYENHGAPFGPSTRAVEIWGQCGQYTTLN